MVDTLRIGESGYGFIFDQFGRYVAHPNSELVGVDASDETFAIEMMQLGQQGRVEEEGNHIIGAASIPQTIAPLLEIL